jgi:pantoate--beta-alanine ligase
MKVTTTVADMRRLRATLIEPVGLTPTMGYLHEGHLSLVRKARNDNQSVVVSIFINPTQFGPGEDLERYPSDIKRDLKLLEKEGVDIAFTPPVAEMYPPHFNSWVEVGNLTSRLEGACRPGHFRGVTTVIAKLFGIIRPNKAYFGQKDAQQALVVKKMVTDLNMNLEVVVLPTVREPDGLAMSSRNRYLNPEERQAATVLHRALTLAQGLWSQGELNAKRLRQAMTGLIQKEPLVTIDYVSIADAETLEELDEIVAPALASLAVKIGSTRLIDNNVLSNSLFSNQQ